VRDGGGSGATYEGSSAQASTGGEHTSGGSR